MDKQKQQLVILGVLVLVLVGFLANAFMPKKKAPPRARPAAGGVSPLVNLKPTAAASAPRTDSGTKATADELKRQQDKAAMEWGVDPFFHTIDREAYQGSSLVLKGISIGKGRRRYATINDEIVTIGDSLFGYRVEEIDRTRVLLKRGAESYYLVFPEQ